MLFEKKNFDEENTKYWRRYGATKIFLRAADAKLVSALTGVGRGEELEPEALKRLIRFKNKILKMGFPW